MFVQYVWQTNRYHSDVRKHYIRNWEGWFLLGIIPLCIKNTRLTIR